jgi:tetratricopeptide (TPR) repeat protein
MIVEKITGKMFADVLKERIFDPLGMVNSGMDLHRPLIKNRASGYFKSWGKFFNANYIEMSTVNGAGGMYSTVEDMFLWDQALYTDTLLPKAYLDAIFEPYVADSDFGGDYGYGWEIGTHKVGSTSKTVNTVSHGGAIDGFCSKFTRVPATQSSIIFLSNNRRAFLNAMTKAILAIMNNEPYYLPKKSVVKAIIKSVKDQGVSQGVVTYKALKDSSDYYMSEEELVIFGYDFLFAGQIDEAITIFEIAIDAYPKAFNVYDSYAEALLASGNKELAIENYQKSIALNPENQNGIQKLKELGVNTDE